MAFGRLLLVWVVIAVSLITTAPGSAQGQWEVLAYTDFMGHFGRILAVAADGSRVIDTPNIPVATLPDLPAGGYYMTTDASLSPDGRWLAVVHAVSDGSAAELMIADVQRGVCCWSYRPLPVVYAFDLGGFDPTSTRLALSYVGEGTNGEPFTGGMAIIPPQFDESAVPQVVPMGFERPLLPELPAGVWARMGRWEADGIRFAPNCYACDGGYMGEYAIWHPDTNTFSAHSGEFFTGFGERLISTGEMIFAGYDTDYVSGTEMGMFPPSNVIRYSAAGTLDEESSYVVFADPRLLDIRSVHWVLDGRAVLIVTLEGYWVLLYRDGTVREIGGVRGHRFFTGTPDGWLTRSGDEEGSNTLWHWTETEKVLVDSYGSGADIRVLHLMPMEQNLSRQPQGFPFWPPPSPEQMLTLQAPPISAEETCPGAPPSRLLVARQARVTPGDPNRVRSAPSLTGTSILGQIPGGSYFMVMDGPVCDTSAGIVWWLVHYGDLAGWTAEGQGNTYFLEPAS